MLKLLGAVHPGFTYQAGINVFLQPRLFAG